MSRSVAIFAAFFSVVSCFLIAQAGARQDQTQNVFAAAKEFLDSGRTHEAEILFKRGLSLYPENGLAHYYYGQLLEKDGRTEGALAEYDRAVKIGKDEEYATKAYLAAELIREKNRAEIARAEAEKIESKRRYDEVYGPAAVERRRAERERQEAEEKRAQAEREATARREAEAAKATAAAAKVDMLGGLTSFVMRNYVMIRTKSGSSQDGGPDVECAWITFKNISWDPEGTPTFKGLKINIKSAKSGNVERMDADSEWVAGQGTTLAISPSDKEQDYALYFKTSAGGLTIVPYTGFKIAYRIRRIGEPCELGHL